MGDSMSTIINATTTNGVVIQPDNSGSLVLQTNSGTTAVTISTAQNVTFAAQATIPTINLTGGQITFPATQSASADANCLDDYEEGTWTPALTSTSGSLTTVVNGTGHYTKIGRVVSITCRPVITTNGTGATALILSNLPFVSSPSTNLSGAGREDAVVGNCFAFSASTSTALYITKYDNNYPGGTGYAFPINFTYFI
jgi:hypothetical protein